MLADRRRRDGGGGGEFDGEEGGGGGADAEGAEGLGDLVQVRTGDQKDGITFVDLWKRAIHFD